MCGIFGVIPSKNWSNQNNLLKTIISNLFLLSSSRGKDASGIAVLTDKEIKINKVPFSPNVLINSSEYINLLSAQNIKVVFGHARMETNGSFSEDCNNQPVIKNNIVTIHNGIIVNDDHLWKINVDLRRNFQVDTEIINSLFSKYIQNDSSLINSTRMVFKQIEGAASIGNMFSEHPYIVLATNTGSMYYLSDLEGSFFIFASEKYFLSRIVDRYFGNHEVNIYQVSPQSGLLIDYEGLEIIKFNLLSTKSDNFPIEKVGTRSKRILINGKLFKNNLNLKVIPKRVVLSRSATEVHKLILKEYQRNTDFIMKLKRCSRCLLPETMPFITYNQKGVCNYCKSYKKKSLLGIEKLNEDLQSIRKIKDRPNCIVAFSGGRDSSYSLHYIKEVLQLNPLAFSYDWGMLTDLGRRNQSRMTSKLGVEHILVSADIQKKRKYIHQNVLAWLKKPHLGTIPLFMAGDKQYFYFANKVKQENQIDKVIMGENYYEKTIFKNGFAGIKQTKTGFMAYDVPSIYKLKMLFFYAGQFLNNPSYLNGSLVDSASAFLSYFMIPHDYINLFDYIKWNEEEVNSVLDIYNWERATDTDTTWRIGDGTAAFYNFIYLTVAGFTELDTFLSNQIREEDISREIALEKLTKYNFPRLNSLEWYCQTIDIDFEASIKKIITIPKLYNHLL